MAPDGVVGLVEDRAGIEEGLGGSEGPLDGLLVAQRDILRVEFGIGAHHPDPVVFRGLGEFFPVEHVGSLPGLEKAGHGPVLEQGLRAWSRNIPGSLATRAARVAASRRAWIGLRQTT